MRQNTLQHYFLTRAYPSGLDPFKSAMDLPRAEAERLNQDFTKMTSSRGNYYEHRQDVEGWLREEAARAGVVIREQNPLYFALSPEALSPPNEGTGVVSLPASGIDLDCCSFTISDSFCNHEFLLTDGQDAFGAHHKWLGRVFNARQMEEVLNEKDLMSALQSGEHAYIEVQMWARPANP